MKKILIAVMGIVGVMLPACTSDDDSRSPSPYKEIVLNQSTRAAADSGNDFAFRLFAELSSESGQKNLVCSPLSVFTTLAMIANGDDGATRDEVLDVLGFKTGQEGVDELNQYCSLMLGELPDLDRSTDVKLANSVWLKDNLILQDSFAARMSEYFNAESGSFTDLRQGIDLVNGWVKRESRGVIESIIDDTSKFELAVANVSYFRGIWKESFDSGRTGSGKFNNADGTVSDARFMRADRIGRYVEAGDLYGVTLDFGNGNYRMTVVRNGEGTSPDLGISEWNELVNSGNGFYISSLEMPVFISTYKENILENLKAMGLSRVADAETGLNNMCIRKADGTDQSMYLRFFNHGVNVSVNEEGAEVAAASVAGGWSTGMSEPRTPKNVVFNVPFIYVISESSTGSIVFMGRVHNMK